ncbi:MAG: hypothetical protein KKA28_10040, partial [Planctomycetes bacterium]|nr:hypothetical protein [Planctomycetota bacterium]
RHNRANECRKAAGDSSQNRNTGFHAIHLPCKYLKNAPQGAFRPKIYPQILLTSLEYNGGVRSSSNP